MLLLPEIYALFMSYITYIEYYPLLISCKRLYKLYDSFMVYYADSMHIPICTNSIKLLNWKYDHGHIQNYDRLVRYTVCNNYYDAFKWAIHKSVCPYDILKYCYFKMDINIIKLIYTLNIIVNDDTYQSASSLNLDLAKRLYYYSNGYIKLQGALNIHILKWAHATQIRIPSYDLIDVPYICNRLDNLIYVHEVMNKRIIDIMYKFMKVGCMDSIKYLYSVGYNFTTTLLQRAIMYKHWHIVHYANRTGFNCSDLVYYDKEWDTWLLWSQHFSCV